VETLLEDLDPVPSSDSRNGDEHVLVGGFGPSITNVVTHGPREQERHLLHDPELPTVRREVEPADVVAIHGQRAALELVEPRHQLAEARFPGTRVADEGEGLP